MKDKPATLAAALLHAALESAKAAFQKKDSRDFFSQIETAVQTGGAVEYLLKFLLASDSPLLVAEVRPSGVTGAIQNRIALSRSAYGPHLVDVKSCSIDDASQMVQEILGMRVVRQTELQSVVKARNAAIHLAILPDNEVQEDNLCTMIAAFEYAARKRPSVAFDALEREQMKAFVERRMQVRYRAAQDKIHLPQGDAPNPGAAGEEFSEKFLARQSEFLDRQAVYVFGTNPHLWNGEHPTTREFLCTRCGQQGIALCWAEGIAFDEFTPGPGGLIEEDGDGGLGLWGMAFACSWCGLTLNSSELLALDSQKDPWAASLLEPHTMTEEEFIDVGEPYRVNIP